MSKISHEKDIYELMKIFQKVFAQIQNYTKFTCIVDPIIFLIWKSGIFQKNKFGCSVFLEPNNLGFSSTFFRYQLQNKQFSEIAR